ncbi:hypothetical protein V2J09_015728 [Rumex salicifolius]
MKQPQPALTRKPLIQSDSRMKQWIGDHEKQVLICSIHKTQMTSALLSPRIIKCSRGDRLTELFKIDTSISVGVSLFDHPGELIGGEGVAKLGHGMRQLSSGDAAISIPIKHVEKHLKLLLSVRGLGRDEIRRYQSDEL